MEVTRTFDLIERYANNFANKADVFVTKINGNWKKYSVSDYIDNSNYRFIYFPSNV